MRVPRLFFKNVRTEPRRFEFRSPHYDPKKRELEERQERLDQEIARERGEVTDEATPPRVSFDRSRRVRAKQSSRTRVIRFVLILAALCYLLYQGILWVETTDFGKVLDSAKNV